MFSLKTDSDSLLTSYVNKLLVVAIVLVLSVFVWLRPFTSVHNVAHAEVISDLPSVVAIAASYQRPTKLSLASGLFWLSPLADPLAVVRILLSSLKTPTQWRGRIYDLR